MQKQLANGFTDFVLRGRNPASHKLRYGIGGTNISDDGKVVFLYFTFRSGQNYCCMESGCHLSLHSESDFERLRECLRSAGLNVEKPMRVHIRFICEGGARFAVNPGHQNPEYRTVDKAWEYEELYDETAAA